MHPNPKPVSGYLFVRELTGGDAWYAKIRLDGRQVQRRVGLVWRKKETPPPGAFTKRGAEKWLADALVDARRGELPGQIKTDTTVSGALDQWLAYKKDRKVKASTFRDYLHMVERMKTIFARPEVGGAKMRIEQVRPETVEAFRDSMLAETDKSGARKVSDSTVNKYLRVIHDFLKWAQRTFKLTGTNAATLVEKRPAPKRANIDVLAPEEVGALVRAAAAEQDGAIFLTAAFAGLRMGELLALRWRDIDFPGEAIHVRQSFTNGILDTTKSGEERVVPMVPEVSEKLAKLWSREKWCSDDDLVFVGRDGGHLSAHKLRPRYKASLTKAGLRELRFHDLRHTFGTLAIREADSREVMEWMGHKDLATTQRYLQFKPQAEPARRLSRVLTMGPVAKISA